MDKGRDKIEKVMREHKHGRLRSGSKDGPVVTSRKQAVAIALSEAREAGAKIPPKKKRRTMVKAVGPYMVTRAGRILLARGCSDCDL